VCPVTIKKLVFVAKNCIIQNLPCELRKSLDFLVLKPIKIEEFRRFLGRRVLNAQGMLHYQIILKTQTMITLFQQICQPQIIFTFIVHKLESSRAHTIQVKAITTSYWCISPPLILHRIKQYKISIFSWTQQRVRRDDVHRIHHQPWRYESYELW